MSGPQHHREWGWHLGKDGGSELPCRFHGSRGKGEHGDRDRGSPKSCRYRLWWLCAWLRADLALAASSSSSCCQMSSFCFLLHRCCCPPNPPPNWENSAFSMICCYPLVDPRRRTHFQVLHEAPSDLAYRPCSFQWGNPTTLILVQGSLRLREAIETDQVQVKSLAPKMPTVYCCCFWLQASQPGIAPQWPDFPCGPRSLWYTTGIWKTRALSQGGIYQAGYLLLGNEREHLMLWARGSSKE